MSGPAVAPKLWIQSKAASRDYQTGYDRIFGKKKPIDKVIETEALAKEVDKPTTTYILIADLVVKVDGFPVSLLEGQSVEMTAVNYTLLSPDTKAKLKRKE